MGRVDGMLGVFSATVLAAAAAVVQAATLGNLTVSSAVGEPFEARLEVRNVSPRSELRVRIAPPARYARLSRKSTPEIQSLKADLKGMNPCVVRIHGRDAVRVSSLDLVIELSEAGRLDSRSYAVVLPKKRGGTAVVSGEPVLEPVKLPLDPREYDVSQPLAVRPGMTSWAVATLYRPLFPRATMTQILVGLVRANPDCFDGGRVNSLRVGCTLTRPSTALVEGIPQDEADDLVHKHPGRSALGAVTRQTKPVPGEPLAVPGDTAGVLPASPPRPELPQPAAVPELQLVPPPPGMQGGDTAGHDGAGRVSGDVRPAPDGGSSVTVRLDESGGSLAAWLAALAAAVAAVAALLFFWRRRSRRPGDDDGQPQEKTVDFLDPEPATEDQFVAVEEAVANRIASDRAAVRGLPDISPARQEGADDLPGVPDDDFAGIIHTPPGGGAVATENAVQASLDLGNDVLPDRFPAAKKPQPAGRVGCARDNSPKGKLEQAKRLLSAGSTDEAIVLLDQVLTEGSVEEKSMARALADAFRRS